MFYYVHYTYTASCSRLCITEDRSTEVEDINLTVMNHELADVQGGSK